MMLSRLSLVKSVPRAIFGARCSSSVGRPGCPPGREVLEGVDEGPERDLVNFPRLKRPLYPGKVRLGFLPEEWFTALYPKTGVTGPYLFGTGLLTYLYSKEWLLTDHEFFVGLSLASIIIFVVKKIGPEYTRFIDAEMDKEESELKKGVEDELKAHEQGIKDEELHQYQIANTAKAMAEAKKDNVALQLETEFRQRQLQVFNEVKRRLDYQLEVANIERRLQQKYMVDWVVTNVLKSLSGRQEKDALAKCITDLKALAAKA
ncbi:putative ATP synthase protein [Tropilaelaps mercedesae]|uniref:ATP synthase subunit b n=1 Tax=Tropilaelaps mercedesae TaxID=418985 RepID=A0A1V9X7P1_9ACAR|nr:putative ATP synthase protein [Tropilaelaps mercedesae]